MATASIAHDILDMQNNLAGTYRSLGRLDDCLRTQRDVYSGNLKLYGEQDIDPLQSATNYALCLGDSERFEEVKSLLRKMMPVARRVLGNCHEITLSMRWTCARVLCQDEGATLADIREAVTMLEDAARTCRRVLGGAHPTTEGVEDSLREAQTALHSSEAPPSETDTP